MKVMTEEQATAHRDFQRAISSVWWALRTVQREVGKYGDPCDSEACELLGQVAQQLIHDRELVVEMIGVYGDDETPEVAS